MMKRMIFSFALLGLINTHSVMARTYQFKNHFEPQNVQWSKSSGDASVAGIGIYRTADGKMQSCAGKRIVYYPYSDYVMEELQARIRGVTSFKNSDLRSVSYRFSTTCDSAGDFHLSRLPAGKWIFTMNIPVVKNNPDYSSYDVSSDLSNVAGEGNGVLFRVVTVVNHKITSVSLVQGAVEPTN